MTSELIVELHVPLLPVKGLDEGEYQFPWIDDIEEALAELEEAGALQVQDDGEEIGDHYVFFLTGASEDRLVAAATRVANLDQVPAGAFAVIADPDDAEPGLGRTITLI